MELTRELIHRAAIKGACLDALTEVSVGDDLMRLPPIYLRWVEDHDLLTPGERADVAPAGLPLDLASGYGDGFGYGYGYGYGSGDGYGYGYGYGYGDGFGYGYDDRLRLTLWGGEP